MAKEKILKKKDRATLIWGICFSFIGITELIGGDKYRLGIVLTVTGLFGIFQAYKEYLRSKYAPRLINIITIFLIVLYSSAFLLWFLEILQII